MATQSFYCSLCEEFSSDENLAEAHLKTDAHNQKFQRFVDDNPQYERTYNLEKAGRVCIKPDTAQDVNLPNKAVERKKSQDAEIVTVDPLSLIQLPPATKPSHPPVVTTQGQATANLSKPAASTSTAITNTSSVLMTIAPSIDSSTSPAIVNHPPPVKKSLPFIGKLPNFRQKAQVRKGATVAPLPASQPPPPPPLPADIEVRRRSSKELDELVAMAAAQSVQEQTASFLLQVTRDQSFFNVPSQVSSLSVNLQISQEMLISHSNASISSYTATHENLGTNLVSTRTPNSNDSLDSFLSIGDSTSSGHKSLPWFSEINTIANTSVVDLSMNTAAKKRKLPRQFSTVADQQSKITKPIQSVLDIPIPAAITSRQMLDQALSSSTTARSKHPPVTIVRVVKSCVATCQNMPPEMRQKYLLMGLPRGPISPTLEISHKKVDQVAVNEDRKVDLVIPTSSSSVEIIPKNEAKSAVSMNKTVDENFPDKVIGGVIDIQAETKSEVKIENKMHPRTSDLKTEIPNDVNNSTNLSENSDSLVVANEDLTVAKTDSSLVDEQVPQASNEPLKYGECSDRALYEAKQKCYAMIAEGNLSKVDSVTTSNDLSGSVIFNVTNGNAGIDTNNDSLVINMQGDVNASKSEVEIDFDTFYSEIKKCEIESLNMTEDVKQESFQIMQTNAIGDASDVTSVISGAENHSDSLKADDFKVNELNRVVSLEGQQQDISENVSCSKKLKYSLLEKLYNSQSSDVSHLTSEVTEKALDVVGNLNTSAKLTDQTADKTLFSIPGINLKIEDGTRNCIALNTKEDLELISQIECNNAVSDKLVDDLITTISDESKVQEISITNQETVAVETCNISVSDVMNQETVAVETCNISVSDVMKIENVLRHEDDKFSNTIKESLAITTSVSSNVEFSQIMVDYNNKRDKLASIKEGNTMIAPVTDESSLIATEGSSLIASVTEGSSLIAPVTDKSSLIAPVTEGSSLIAPVTDESSFIAPVTEGSSLIAPVTDETTMIASVTEVKPIRPDMDVVKMDFMSNVPMRYLESDVIKENKYTGTVMNSQDVQGTVSDKVEENSEQFSTDHSILSSGYTNIGVVSDIGIATNAVVPMEKDIQPSSDTGHDLDRALIDKVNECSPIDAGIVTASILSTTDKEKVSVITFQNEPLLLADSFQPENQAITAKQDVKSEIVEIKVSEISQSSILEPELKCESNKTATFESPSIGFQLDGATIDLKVEQVCSKTSDSSSEPDTPAPSQDVDVHQNKYSTPEINLLCNIPAVVEVDLSLPISSTDKLRDVDIQGANRILGEDQSVRLSVLGVSSNVEPAIVAMNTKVSPILNCAIAETSRNLKIMTADVPRMEECATVRPKTGGVDKNIPTVQEDYINNWTNGENSNIRSSFEIVQSWSVVTEQSSTVAPVCETDQMNLIEINAAGNIEKELSHKNVASMCFATDVAVTQVKPQLDINESDCQTDSPVRLIQESKKITSVQEESDCFISEVENGESSIANEYTLSIIKSVHGCGSEPSYGTMGIKQTVGDNVLVGEIGKVSSVPTSLELNCSMISSLPMNIPADTDVTSTVSDLFTFEKSVSSGTEFGVEQSAVKASEIIDIDSD